MGKTVTTYLIDGDPKGTQYSFISNKICLMQEIPTPEAQQRCASTSHNEELPVFVCSSRPFSLKLPPFSSTLIHTDPI